MKALGFEVTEGVGKTGIVALSNYGFALDGFQGPVALSAAKDLMAFQRAHRSQAP